MAPPTAPIFPMPRHFQFDYVCFDPQLDYAQVLAEAEMNQQAQKHSPQQEICVSSDRRLATPNLLGGISSYAGHLEELKGGRRSWKSSLLFWRKVQKKHKAQSSTVLTPQHSGFKSRSKPSAGPLYMNDFHAGPSHCRSSRGSSGPLAGILKKGAEIPYVSLGHKNGQSRAPAARPIYLVT